MNWEFDSSRPIYTQLCDLLLGKILSGIYQSGEKLPSVRELAAEAGVNPNTVQRALSELERQGYVYTLRTNGRFVTSDEALLQEGKRLAAQTVTREWLTKMAGYGYDRPAAQEFLMGLSQMEE